LASNAAAKLLTRDEARRIAPTSPSCRTFCDGPTPADDYDKLAQAEQRSNGERPAAA